MANYYSCLWDSGAGGSISAMDTYPYVWCYNNDFGTGLDRGWTLQGCRTLPRSGWWYIDDCLYPACPCCSSGYKGSTRRSSGSRHLGVNSCLARYRGCYTVCHSLSQRCRTYCYWLWSLCLYRSRCAGADLWNYDVGESLSYGAH